MPAKKNDAVAAIATEDGHAILGGRPGEGTMYRNTTSWGAPLPEESHRASGTGARSPQPVPAPDGPSLPGVHVSRQVLGREIQRLTAKADGIERYLARGVLGVAGTVVPHMVDAHAASRVELERLRAEIERLNGLSDHEARLLAFEHGAR